MSEVKKKVVLFNGAPNSGKDASAEIMKGLFGFGAIHAFKDALYTETAKYFALDEAEFKRMATDRNLKEKKTNKITHRKSLGIFRQILMMLMSIFYTVGISPREALIYVSEQFIKPRWGKTYFGKKLVEKIQGSDEEFFYIPDSGFVDELRPLIEAGFEVYLVRLHRDGATFDGDSRTLMTDELVAEFGIKTFDVDNNGTLEDLEQNLLEIAMGVLK